MVSTQHGFHHPRVPAVSRSETQALIRQVLDEFGVTPFQFSRLVGVEDPGTVYHWLAAETKPCRFNLFRIIRLAMLHQPKPSTATLPLHRLSRIDWRHEEVFWRDGRVTTLEGELIEYRSRGGRKLRQPGVVVASDYVSSRDHDPASGDDDNG